MCFFAFCNLSGSKLMPLGRPGNPAVAHLNALELHLALLKHPFGPVWNLFGGLRWHLGFTCRSFGCVWSHLGCILTWFDILLGSAWTFCDLISLWSKKLAAWGGRLFWFSDSLESEGWQEVPGQRPWSFQMTVFVKSTFRFMQQGPNANKRSGPLKTIHLDGYVQRLNADIVLKGQSKIDCEESPFGNRLHKEFWISNTM